MDQVGFEPTTLTVQMSCSSQLELLAHYVVCGHQENRTLLSLLAREKRQPWYMRAQMLGLHALEFNQHLLAFTPDELTLLKHDT